MESPGPTRQPIPTAPAFTILLRYLASPAIRGR